VESRSSCDYVGLKNAGATCYMNSVIQQLFLIPGIKEALLSIDDEDSDEDTLFFQFQMVMGHLQVNSSVSSRYRELSKNICILFPFSRRTRSYSITSQKSFGDAFVSAGNPLTCVNNKIPLNFSLILLTVLVSNFFV